MTQCYFVGYIICKLFQMLVETQMGKITYFLYKYRWSLSCLQGCWFPVRSMIEAFLLHILQEAPFFCSPVQAFSQITLYLHGALGNLCTDIQYWGKKTQQPNNFVLNTHALIYLMDECYLLHTMGTGMNCSRLREEWKYTVDNNSCRCGNRGGYKFLLNLVPNGVVFFQ